MGFQRGSDVTMKKSQSQIILDVLAESPEGLLSYQLCKVDTKYGWLGLQAPRRARELAAEGVIEAEGDGKYTRYKRKELTLFK